MKMTGNRIILLCTLALAAAVSITSATAKLPLRKTKAERFTSTAPARPEGPARMFYIPGMTSMVPDATSKPAKTGFDNLTNGFAPQGPDFDKIDEDNVVPTRSFNDGRFVFEERGNTCGRRWTYLQRPRHARIAIKTSLPAEPAR
jgi:hypothetical protein